MNTNINENVKELKNTIKDFRDKLSRMLKMCESKDLKINDAFEILNDGMLNLSDITHYNTEIQKEIEVRKEITNKKKERVEDKNLNFQNYLYQKEHIVTQINACMNYPTTQMDKIELPNIEEVKEIIMKDDINKIDILNYELQVRKELNETVKKINEEKEDNLLKLKEKEKFSKELPNYLTSLENATLKAQKYLNLNITEYNTYLSLASKLPPPLYVIYNSLLCLSNEFSSSLKILGKTQLVEEFYNTYQLDNINFDDLDLSEDNFKEEGEHSDEEVGEAINKRKRTRSTKNFTKITKFPLYVQFSINKVDTINPENLPIIINFYFVPLFNAVTVEAFNKSFKSVHLLSNMFKNISIVPESDIERAISIY